MSISIHVASTYQVEHAVLGSFCNKKSQINRFLSENCPGLDWEGEDVCYSTHLEVPRSDLGNLIGKITKDRDDFEKWAKKVDIRMSADEFICVIASWISDSDQRNEFVVLSWF